MKLTRRTARCSNSLTHYEKTGEFRNGTVMIKELVNVGAKEATSGKGSFMGDFRGLEASIKDSKRFKDEPGSWAYFTISVSSGPSHRLDAASGLIRASKVAVSSSARLAFW